MTLLRAAALRQLHPSIPRPVRGRRAAGSLAALDAAGWVRFAGARAVGPALLSHYTITALGARRLAEWEAAQAHAANGGAR